ncbi:MAG: DUF362 domain-containing protein [Magnetococcales bacterium]|nr:DUF362 domain-containing protein [Magnetococcales bacterium]
MATTRRKKKSNLKQPMQTRRQLLKHIAVNSGLALGVGGVAWWRWSQDPVVEKITPVAEWKNYRVAPSNHYPVMAVIHGQQVPAMVRQGVDSLGGITRFINKGDRVLLKPNVGWDRQPEQAANTGPELVNAVATLCREAGAASVWVTDVSLNDPARCFSRSGIEKAAIEAGAQVRLPTHNDFVDTQMGGQLLKVWPVPRFFHEADKVINLPIVKHHSLCGCTLSMKNWYGVIGGKRNRLHQSIHQSIVDLASAVRPTMTIMDATRVLKRNGPTGGSLADVSFEETIIVSLDEVALDAYALRFLDLQPDAVPFLAMAETAGLGVVDWRSLNVVERQVG